MKFFSILTLVSFFLSQSAYAADTGIVLSKELLGQGKGAEYISGDYPGAVMMKINLWGSVQRPGIHYVPAKTDLITLLSYSGGPTERAILDEVLIKRNTGGKDAVFEVDVEDILTSSKGKTIPLEANDIVIIQTKTPLFSENTMQVISVLGGVLGITLSYLILKERL